MEKPTNIGRKVTFKYCLSGFILMALILLLIGNYFFFFQDWSLNVGGKLGIPFQLVLQTIVFIFAATILIYSIGGWAGNKIITGLKSPYLISILTLSAIFIMLTAITEKLVLSIQGLMMALVLGHFMGKEIKRKGEATRNTREN